ncbi:DUF302 domain-containing protein [Methylocella tundrae]|uniref:DUF302 domain-containing protein n=1 Tax=Methylocella tundrae TaxID=227605 RepID=A0A4U8Z700_METTU|nr:DUF302 domain-containing protein [Methylocella tundrae]WPP04632.1 DUF302 domain-containing protein [Methylocella tundrae]VFU11073.1 conserved protein of unknown function [Methylocella tundrae]
MLDNGVITVSSPHTVEETVSRFEAALKAHKVTLFAKIDHAAGAGEAGMTLRPTLLLIFGSPRTGTPLMQHNQEIGLDLPMKALIWQDADGKVWLSSNDPAWLVRRHRLGDAVEETVAALENGLAVLTQEASAG